MLTNKNLSFILLFTLITAPCLSLDIFFFSKFYNDGMCKSTEELSKYMLKSKRDSPTFNVLEPLLLTNTENPIVDFGLYLTNNKKSELQGAHAFFKNVYPALSETHQIYFPDMITCVTKIPYFSFFGFRDTYGLMYNLVPSLEQNREEDLSGDEYTLNDFVDIYLDTFKALQVLISHDYFLTEISHDEIGVVYNAEDVNTHIRGKLRHLHHLRTTAKNCHPHNMKNFEQMMGSLAKHHYNPSQVEMDSSNVCQVMNVHNTWGLFIESLTSYYNRQKGVYFNFSNCIQDMVQRHNSPEMNGPQGFCPEEIQVAWKNIEIRRSLRSMENNGLIYTSKSAANFYIYVLTRMKAGFMENMVSGELDAYEESLTQKSKIISEIKEDKRKLTELEEIEQMILSQETKKREQKVEKNDSFAEIIKDAELSPKIVDEQSEKTSIHRSSSKRNNSKIFDELDINEDAEIKIEEIEQKKSQIEQNEKDLKDQLQDSLDGKRKEIIFKFQRLVQKALIKDRKEKKEKQDKIEEMAEIQKNKQIKKKEKIKKFNTMEIDTKSEDQVNEKIDENFVTKIVIDSNPVKKEKSNHSSEEISEDDISDYNSSNSSESSVELLEEDNQIIKELNDEKMAINGIQINFDEDADLNRSIINKFEDEVHGKGITKNQEDESEDSVIMKDKAHALKNNETILKHNLEGYVLAEASTEMQKREILKLKEVKEIYSLRDRLIVLIDQGKAADDGAVVELKNQILKNVHSLIDQFGEAESLIEFDKSLEHYTLGNLRDDLTKGELGYVEKLQSLTPTQNFM